MKKSIITVNKGLQPLVGANEIARGHAPLSIVAILFISLFTTNLYSQILYNQEMPPSYSSENIIGLDELPIINFRVSENGNLSENNININIKDYLVYEKIGEKKIARARLTIDVFSMGKISIGFKDVILDNKTHCYIYTNDYKIVAGPIYQDNINDNYLNIVELPARELILEIVYDEKDDFNFTLESIRYRSSSKKNNKLQTSSQPEAEHAYCDDFENYYGERRYDTEFERCSYFGGDNENDDIFTDDIFLESVNDKNMDISRASCILIAYNDNTSNGYYCPRPATLMNFPYDSCSSSFLISCFHRGVYSIIKEATLDLDSINSIEAEAYLNGIIIRFNSHYKYGTPWHLKDIDCEDNGENFELWRSTVDFDEVIDYCGLSYFAYSPNRDTVINGNFVVTDSSDISIFKMMQKPFYKELHLGWTAQSDYDSTFNVSFLGRYNQIPTSFVIANPVGDNVMSIGNHIYECQAFKNRDDNGMIGWSGSQAVINKDNTWLGLGLLQYGSSFFGDGEIKGCDYYYHFYDSTHQNMYFLEQGNYYSADSAVNMYDHYLSDYSSMLNDQDSFDGVWMPSMENRDKCPSEMYDAQDTCSFDISELIDIDTTGDNICFDIPSIPSIPSTYFPDSEIPAGIRIYQNSGDQKTFYYHDFNSSTNLFPINGCIDACDIFYYSSLGLDSLELAFDFYDEYGKVINNDGCRATFKIDIPDFGSICDYIDISYERIGTSCNYDISLSFDFPEYNTICDDYEYIKSTIMKKVYDDSFICLEDDNPLRFIYIDNNNSDFGIPEINYENANITMLFRANSSESQPVSFGFIFNGDTCLTDTTLFDCNCENCCEDFEKITIPAFSIVTQSYIGSLVEISRKITVGQCELDSIKVKIDNGSWVSPACDTIVEPFIIDGKVLYNTNYLYSHIHTEADIPFCIYFYIDLADDCVCYDTICRTTIPDWDIIFTLDGPPSISVNTNIGTIDLDTSFHHTSVRIIDDGGIVLDGGDSHELDITGVSVGTYYLVFKHEDIDDFAIEIEIQ